jgi:hypothetical protein
MQTEAPGLGVSKEGFDFEPPPIPPLSFSQGLGAGHQVKVFPGSFMPQDSDIDGANLLLGKVDLA